MRQHGHTYTIQPPWSQKQIAQGAFSQTSQKTASFQKKKKKNSIGIGAVLAALLSEQPPNVPVDRHEAVVARQTASTRAFIGLNLAFLAWLGSVFPFI